MTTSTHQTPLWPQNDARVPQRLMVPCDDGWSLALHRFAPAEPSRRSPVLMVHGIAANRLHFDPDVRHSLARAVCARGFDTYVLELRGAGDSVPPAGMRAGRVSYGLSDYTERDVPTAISWLLEHTGTKSLHAIGHSMGGMILLAVATRACAELKSLTCIGSPLIGALAQALGPKERRISTLVAHLSPAANFTPPSQRRVPLRRLLTAAGLLMPLSTRLADDLLLNVANCDPAVLTRILRHGIHDIPVQLLTEIFAHMAGTASPMGPYAYEALLARISAPVLAICGSADRIAPPASIAQMVGQMRSPDVRFREMGTAQGDRCDYGHLDLLVGSHAPDEVYPLITAFLQQIDAT
jgi:pimeloyl-ACP methyl ester carboxylesterase